MAALNGIDKVHLRRLNKQSVRKGQRAVARRVVVGHEAGGHVRAPIHVGRPLVEGEVARPVRQADHGPRLDAERRRNPEGRDVVAEVNVDERRRETPSATTVDSQSSGSSAPGTVMWSVRSVARSLSTWYTSAPPVRSRIAACRVTRTGAGRARVFVSFTTASTASRRGVSKNTARFAMIVAVRAFRAGFPRRQERRVARPEHDAVAEPRKGRVRRAAQPEGGEVGHREWCCWVDEMPGALFINPVGKRALSKTTRSPARVPAAARRDDAVTVVVCCPAARASSRRPPPRRGRAAALARAPPLLRRRRGLLAVLAAA